MYQTNIKYSSNKIDWRAPNRRKCRAIMFKYIGHRAMPNRRIYDRFIYKTPKNHYWINSTQSQTFDDDYIIIIIYKFIYIRMIGHRQLMRFQCWFGWLAFPLFFSFFLWPNQTIKKKKKERPHRHNTPIEGNFLRTTKSTRYDSVRTGIATLSLWNKQQTINGIFFFFLFLRVEEQSD